MADWPADCADKDCNGCFETNGCSWCKGGFFDAYRSSCKHTRDCDSDKRVPQSKQVFECEDRCQRHKCHACFDDPKCSWCEETASFDECRATQLCDGFLQTPIAMTTAKRDEFCGTECKTLDCHSCFESPDCDMCTGVGGLFNHCTNKGGSCGFLRSVRSQNEQEATCGKADPCNQHDDNCQACLNARGCSLCGYDGAQTCVSEAEACPGSLVERFTCKKWYVAALVVV